MSTSSAANVADGSPTSRSQTRIGTDGIRRAGSLAPIMDEQREMTLRDYGRIVWRRKWIVAAAVTTALAGALALSFLQDPIYAAEAQMLVEPRSGNAVFEADPTLNVQNLERAIQ